MAVYALAVLDEGRRAVSASKDGTLRVWDLGVEPVPEPDFAHAAAVDALAARTGIAVSGARDRCLAVWELETGRAIRHWDAHAGREFHEGWVTAVALDPDGDTIHSAGQDGALKTWTADGTPVDAVQGDWGSSENTALARDVPLLVGGYGSYGDARLSFWRPGRKTRLGRVKVGQAVPRSASRPAAASRSPPTSTAASSWSIRRRAACSGPRKAEKGAATTRRTSRSALTAGGRSSA